jgi:beta-mannanase
VGVAAYNRGTRRLIADIDSTARSAEFAIMDGLNALSKHKHAVRPFGSIQFANDGRYWWALDPRKGWSGYGYVYKTLHDAVRDWLVTIVGFDNGTWIGDPIS